MYVLCTHSERCLYCLLIKHTLAQKHITNTEIIYITNIRYMNYNKYLTIVYKLCTIYSVASSLIKLSIYNKVKQSLVYTSKSHFSNNKGFNCTIIIRFASHNRGG